MESISQVQGSTDIVRKGVTYRVHAISNADGPLHCHAQVRALRLVLRE